MQSELPAGIKPMTSQPGGLSSDARAMMLFEANKKTAVVAYLLWFFLGLLGGHNFYLKRTGVAVAQLILSITLVGIFVAATEEMPSTETLITAGIVIYIPMFISGLAVGIKRLHDRDKSGWWMLVFYGIPAVLGIVGFYLDEPANTLLGLVALLIYIWAFVELGCLRGTIGANQYGPDPLAAPLAPKIGR